MDKDITPISGARSPQEVGEYWDQHDLDEIWDKTKPESFEVQIQSQSIYYPVETGLSEKLRSAAERHGVSAETLLNLWLQERMEQEASVS